MSELRNEDRSWAGYMGGLLNGNERINQLAPTHPYLEDIPLLEKMLHDNTRYFLLLTLEETRHIVSDLFGSIDGFFSKELGGGNIKEIWDGSKNITKLSTWYNEDSRLVFRLKNLAIKAKPYKINGVTYIKITGYAGLRRILSGTRYGAMHPQMLELGIGAYGRFHNIVRGIRFCIVFSLAWRGIELVLKEDYTLVDFLVDIPVDVAKAVVAGGIEFAAGGVLALFSAPVIVDVSFTIILGAVLNCTLNVLDERYHISVSIKEKVREAFQDSFKIRQWHQQHLPYDLYLFYNSRN